MRTGIWQFIATKNAISIWYMMYRSTVYSIERLQTKTKPLQTARCMTHHHAPSDTHCMPFSTQQTLWWKPSEYCGKTGYWLGLEKLPSSYSPCGCSACCSWRVGGQMREQKVMHAGVCVSRNPNVYVRISLGLVVYCLRGLIIFSVESEVRYTVSHVPFY